MKKVLALAVVALALTASSCMIGQDGKIYGEFYYDGNSCSINELGGFPYPYYPEQYTEISPGTYSVIYNVYYSSSVQYYPGPNSSSYFHSTYTVSANPGELFQDGADKYFSLWLSDHGLDGYGNYANIALSQASGTKPAPRLGTYSWSQNGLTITVTNSIVQLTADQLAKLHMTQVKK
jgi:hypothetical protein